MLLMVDHTLNQVLTQPQQLSQTQCLHLLQQITMACGTWYKAIELENVFFLAPIRKEDQKQFA